MKIEDLNTVHGLTKEIERLRAGEEDGATPEVKLTAGQLWKRLLDLNGKKRIEMLRSLLESADEGSTCRMENHSYELDHLYRNAVELSTALREWNTAWRLITVFIGNLREDQQGAVERGTVADRLELLLKGGTGPVPGRITCGYRWTEMRQQFICAEPVDSSGAHQGGHHAYVHKGISADEELRMKYLEEENDALRKRLGLPLNKRRA